MVLSIRIAVIITVIDFKQNLFEENKMNWMTTLS